MRETVIRKRKRTLSTRAAAGSATFADGCQRIQDLSASQSVQQHRKCEFVELNEKSLDWPLFPHFVKLSSILTYIKSLPLPFHTSHVKHEEQTQIYPRKTFQYTMKLIPRLLCALAAVAAAASLPSHPHADRHKLVDLMGMSRFQCVVSSPKSLHASHSSS